MISYEQLCEALDRYNARRQREPIGGPSTDQALPVVGAIQTPEVVRSAVDPATEGSDSIEVDESMIDGSRGPSAEEPGGEWEAVPLTGDIAPQGSDEFAGERATWSRPDEDDEPV